MIQLVLLVFFGFIGTEIFSYFAHRFLFHGLLWKIHVTHHTTRRSVFELNDLFSLFFAAISILLMAFGNNSAFAVGLGIGIYGVLYFIIHDFFTHRRFLPFASKNRILQRVRKAHQRHHQSIEKSGLEPFGLFLFDYKNY